MRLHYILLFFLFVFTLPLQGQNACNLVVEAGDDVTICEGDNTTLDGVVTGGVNPTFEWTPVQGLSNPAILNPVASPVTTTTYFLTAMASSDNLIVNGDFETGTIDPATTMYTLVSDPVAIATNAPNFYAILSVPQIVQAFGCTPDIGLYTMVIHGSTGVSVNFWCQSINVTPNTDYKFSFKVFGIPYFFAPAPNIVLKVNGVQIGSITAPNGLCAEDSGNFTWNSGASTTADVCLANATVAGLGSMCSVDDIEMVECCTASDSVTVTVAQNISENQAYTLCEGDEVVVGGQTFSDAGNYEVVLQNFQGCDSTIQITIEVAEIEAFITVSNMLNCLNDQAVLDGSLSTGTFGIQTYTWSTLNGQFLSGTSNPSVTIGSPGDYTLIVTTSNGLITCSDAITITVPIDTVSPQFQIDMPPMASCQDTAISLSAQGFNLPGNAIITWTTLNGMIISGAATMTPLVQGPGTYILTVIDPSNGCFTQDSVIVQPGGDIPVIQPITIPVLTCLDTLTQIVVAVVQPDTGYSVLWTTLDGNIVSGDTTLSPFINKGGNYLIIVTENSSGCTGSLTIGVDVHQDIPVLSLPASDSMDCLEDSLLLNAQVVAGFNTLHFQWTTADGQILSGQDSLSAWAGMPGSYLIVAIDSTTGCRDSAQIIVISNGALPAVMVGPDLVINCAVDTVFPQTAGTVFGPEYDYLWTTSNGNLPNDTLLQPGIFSPGTYVLQVINNLNFCTATDTLQVTSNTSPPGVTIVLPDTLDCLTTQIQLNASTIPLVGISLNWTGPPGGILTGGTSQNPSIGSPGWYVLTALDTNNLCVAMDSVLAIQDIVAPMISIVAPDSLDCNTSTLALDASSSSPAGRITFAWSTPNGMFVSGSTTANPVVNAGGTYVLVLTDNINGCTATQMVDVFQDPGLPSASIAVPDTLTCLVTDITLTATTLNVAPGASFQWTTTGGQINGPTDGLSATVTQPGTYVFNLTDPANGCMATAQALVVENIFVPQVQVPNPPLITCLLPQAILNAQPINYNGQLNYQWSQTGGPVLASISSLTTTNAGSYVLVWTVPENGCSDSMVIDVFENLLAPVANAGTDQILPCNTPSGTLDGTASQGQGLLDFQWSTINGQLLGNGQTATPAIQNQGLYTLLVTDPVNGCTDTDEVQVSYSTSGSYNIQVTAPPCAGTSGTIIVQNTAGGIPPFTIHIPGQSDTFTIGQVISLQEGNWTVLVIDGTGCPLDTIINIPSGTSINLQAPTEIQVGNGSPGIITLSGNFTAGSIASITWTPDQYLTATADPFVWSTNPPSDIAYQVTVITVDGCEASATIQVRVSDIRSLYVPNAFSPNNPDGINDAFFPHSKAGNFDRIKSMAIYDRWGNSLFLKEDFPVGIASEGWDGTYRGKPLDPGVYVWVIEVALPNGGIRTYKGDVTLF